LLSDASREHDLRDGVVHPHPCPLINEKEVFTLTSVLSPQGRGRSRKRFSIGCGRVGEGGREQSEKSKRSI
jgi:hypothetical protein